MAPEVRTCLERHMNDFSKLSVMCSSALGFVFEETLIIVFSPQTYNDILRISLVSGLHTPRSSCSKLDMRATPDPVRIKIERRI